ncbi:unnamed protein product [Ambrosiozyma monospora]|uniref:Unnamed protein product n=1 Tax=Ambrosiozyma monospora TaxID=43982 RepID=A0A9W6T4D4_AMBMO|nr:unnamed protein product [Ambrosiozyma monospora]
MLQPRHPISPTSKITDPNHKHRYTYSVAQISDKMNYRYKWIKVVSQSSIEDLELPNLTTFQCVEIVDLTEILQCGHSNNNKSSSSSSNNNNNNSNELSLYYYYAIIMLLLSNAFNCCFIHNCLVPTGPAIKVILPKQ